MFYNDDATTGEIDSLNIGAGQGGYSDLSLNGKNILLNEKQPVPDPLKPPFQPGNVGIGLISGGNPPKNKLDVAGAVAIGSSYAGNQTARENGLLVEGVVGIGANVVNAMFPHFVDNKFVKAENSDVKLVVNGGIAIHSNDNFHIGPWDLSQDGGGDVTSHLYIRRWTGNGIESWSEVMCWFEWDKEFYCASDKKVKEDVKPLEGSLDKISKLRGVSYLSHTESSEDVRGTRRPNTTPRQVGFVAQEVETVLPEVVGTAGDGTKGLAYGKMTAVLVEAVKELKTQNDALKTIVCQDHPEETICK
jgi:hypothetical protein